MNINEARAETHRLFRAGNAVMWRSSSGIGKSQVAYSMFEEIRDRDALKGIRWGFCNFFAATQTPSDIIGLNFKGERSYDYVDPTSGQTKTKTVTVTDPAVPLWMMSSEGIPAFMYDRVFLLIDEYGQGDAETKRSIAEIFLNGGTPPWYLPAGSIRLACTNEGSRYGVSKDFDFVIARRCVIDIEGSPAAFLAYADKPYVHQGRQWITTPVVKAWAEKNPTLLFETEPAKQGPWGNPRQICAVDRYLQTCWEDMNDNTAMTPQMISTVAGMVGMPVTQSIITHVQFLTQLPSYDDVVKDPANCPVPQRGDLLMLMAYQLAGYTKVEDLAACITYVQRLPKDMGVTYISALLRRDYRGIINQPAMQAWINKNAQLVAIISALSS